MKICFVTTGQPSTNPRLVKEADACAEAGHEVCVIAAHWAEWATPFDAQLLASRRWHYTFIDWRLDASRLLFWKTRLRHYAARTAARRIGWSSLQDAAISRVGPELRRAAAAMDADLFIAHNLGALPAAIAAARSCGARVGFDAEDFHSGQIAADDSAALRLTRAVEQRYLPQCDYVTAASPGIAEAYRDLCGIPLPVCILNVFPLAERPAHFREREPGAPVRLYWFSQTIGPDRGLEQAVAALGMLGRTDVELHLRGHWQAGFEAKLRDVAARSGVDASRLVALPPAPADVMVREAARYDVGLALEPPVTPNNNILVSNKVFTYVLAGAAIVLTRTSGQARLLPDLGDAAGACQPGDASSLARAISDLIGSTDRLERARRTAWNLGEQRFNWDIEKQAFLAVTTHVMAGPRHRAAVA